MNIHSIFVRILAAGACWLTLAGVATAARSATEDLSTWNSCSGPRYTGHVPQIQAQLNRIYNGDKAFQEAAGEGKTPLKDGVLGPVTLYWLGKFCEQHPFKAGKPTFEADVIAALLAYPRETPGKAAPAAPAQAQPMDPLDTMFRYDPKSLRQPRNVEAILPRLRQLTDRYADLAQFKEAVARALPGQRLDGETLDQIVLYSRIDGYSLPGEKVNEMKNVSAGLKERLAAAAGVEFDNAAAFHLGLDAAAGDGPEKAELGRNIAQVDAISLKVQYQIPGTIAADLAGAAELAPPIIKLYHGMEGIAYPSRALLELALRARLERALNMCPANRYRHDAPLENDDIQPLLELAGSSGRADLVMRLRGQRLRCSETQSKEAKALIDATHAALYAMLEKTLLLSTRGTAPALAAQAGPVASAGCGCAPDAVEGMVYGFYPLWATGQTAQPAASKPALDFDVLSRVGLYGMTINDRGGLELPANVANYPWTLLEEAHRHRTKVDWVVSKDSWDGTGSRGIPGLLDNLRLSIGELLKMDFPKPDLRGTALASLGLERGPSAGDGVTLRFENFPPEEHAALQGFVKALAQDLRAMKPARQLFLLVAQSDIVAAASDQREGASETRPFSAINLHDLMQQANFIDETADPVDKKRQREDDLRILVLLEEPTANQKLVLRADVENALFSGQRVRVLRNIIPIVEYDGVRLNQLNDDIIYFQDNFGGIGFWPMPFAQPGDDVAGATSANAILHSYFNRDGVDGGVLANLVDLICPNRAWLRWLAWVSAIAAVAAGITLARCRGCGTRLDKNRWYLIGMIALIVLPFIVITALVVGDPLFKSESGVHWIIAAVLLAVVIVPGIYGLLRPERKLP